MKKMPNWLTMITSQQSRLRKAIFLSGLLVALVIVFRAIEGEPNRPPTPYQAAETTEKPGNLATRDAVITGLTRENQRRGLMTQKEIELLKGQVKILQRQLELAAQNKSQVRATSQQKPKASLTPEQVAQIASQQIKLSQTPPPAAQKPQASPLVRRQRVGPKEMPRKAAARPPEPKWVTIPAGSTAKAIFDDGLAWIADGSERFHKIRIAAIHTPNQRTIPLGDCHVMMRSELRIATEVVARLPLEGDVLSCVLPDGETMEVEFKGYAMSSDDVQGIEVKVFSNDWDILKEFGKAAIPVAIARAVDGATRIATTPLGTISQSGGSALSDIATQMSEFYLENARTFARKLLWANPHQDIYVTFRRQVQLRGVTAGRLAAASSTLNRGEFN